MLFIFEGADRVGKSSVIKQLAFQLGTNVTLMHFQKPPVPIDQAYEYQKKTFTDLINNLIQTLITNPDTHIILDRSHIGELVYGPLRNANHSYDYVYDLHKLLVTTLHKHGIPVITTLILTPITDDPSAPFGNGQDIEQAFVNIFKQLYGIRLVFNNVNFRSLDDKINSIITVINNVAEQKLVVYPTVVGIDVPYKFTMFSPKSFTHQTCNQPCNDRLYNFHVSSTAYGPRYGVTQPLGLNDKYIFVGEAPGIKGCGFTGIPFYGDRSGMLLRSVLTRYGINPDLDIVITNAFWCNPPNNKIADFKAYTCSKFEQYILAHKQSKIIALGRTAEQQLTKIGRAPDAALYHPAYYLYQHRYDEIYKDYYNVLQQLMPHKLLLHND